MSGTGSSPIINRAQATGLIKLIATERKTMRILILLTLILSAGLLTSCIGSDCYAGLPGSAE